MEEETLLHRLNLVQVPYRKSLIITSRSSIDHGNHCEAPNPQDSHLRGCEKKGLEDFELNSFALLLLLLDDDL